MKRNGWVTLPIFVLWMLLGCSPNTGTTTQDTDTTDTTVLDLVDDAQTDIDNPDVPDTDVVAPDAADVDSVEPDVDCNECEEGQVKCDSATKYWVCEQQNNCWVWGSKSLCPASEVCVCGEEVCIPDGEPCACIPDCLDTECGYDGCGGYCGSGLPENLGCQADYHCVEGACISDEICTTECNEGETLCNGIKIVNCENLFADDPLKEACWVFGADVQDCPTNEYCQFDECYCPNTQCGDTCCNTADYVCLGSACCLPNCDGKECGDDGCGGSCGTCPMDSPICDEGFCTDECIPDCVQGDQKCIGATGYKTCVQQSGCWKWSLLTFGCNANEVCAPSADNECVCIPNCTGKDCGADGCGGSCGTCPVGTACQNESQCVCNIPINDPVCDLDSGTTYANECEAMLAGATNLDKGACPTCFDLCTADELQNMEICGSDGMTYQSFCELSCTIGTLACVDLFNCPQIKYLGACQVDVWPGCTQNYEPVCATLGADSITFHNRCDYLGNSTATGGEYFGATFFCNGDCLDDTICSTVCPNTCEPVCGLLPNGTPHTYMNQCVLDCAGATFHEEGRCCTECGEYEEWVCSSAFNAYQNDCIMLCKAEDEFPALYDIPMAPDGTMRLDICEECQCNLADENQTPVCGSDYVTYTNSCALECGEGITTACEDECGFDTCPCPVGTQGFSIASEVADPPVAADDLKRGVCGADGRTYGNACSAIYNGTYVVQETWCASCAAECSGTEYDPVCCEDEVTYPNLCIPEKCNSLLSPSLCRKGRCCADAGDCDDGDETTADSCNLGVCENL